ncbi:MAG: hypothetical protein H7124_17250 [Phycisphaerales bacterium]|nr:hypothetical protein [Hyphomonadaceae bacterium]
MKLTPPPITQEKLQAYTVCAALWLVRLAAFLARWTHPRATRALKRYVRSKERFVSQVLFLTAIARIRHRPTVQLRTGCKPGFRVTCGHVRLLIKSARLARTQAPMRERILHLIAALAAPERYIRHFIKRLRKGVRVVRMKACAPPADALAASPAYAVACADSS